MKGLVYKVNPAGWAACWCLKRLWPGCLVSPLSGLALRELPPPALPGEDWVLCRTRLGGICGSDLAILAQRQPANSILQCYSSFPAVLGHENVAVVEQVGSAVDSSWLGRRVCVDPGLTCAVRGIEPACPSCRAGRFGACENFAASSPHPTLSRGERGEEARQANAGRAKLGPGSCIGYCGPVGGTWGEFFAAHVSQLFAVPDALDDRQAVLTDPLACGLHAVLQVDLARARRVLVYGAGMLGLAVTWALRGVGCGAQVDIIARHGFQRELARELGAQPLDLPDEPARRFGAVAHRTGSGVLEARFRNLHLAGGYELVFDCAGSVASIAESIKWTRPGGQLVLVGTGHGRGVDLTPVWFGELTVIGSSGRAIESLPATGTTAPRREHTYVLTHERMAAGPFDVGRLLTHTFALCDYRQALRAAMDKSASGAVKVAFDLRQ